VMTATPANASSKRAVDAPADRFVGEVLRQVVTLVRRPLRFMLAARRPLFPRLFSIVRVLPRRRRAECGGECRQDQCAGHCGGATGWLMFGGVADGPPRP